MRNVFRCFAVWLVLFGYAPDIFSAITDDSEKKVFLDEKLNIVKNPRDAVFYRLAEPAENGTWLVKAYFMNGKIKMEGSYLDQDITVPHGIFRFYYENGQVESFGQYLNGSKLGVWKRYTETGAEKPEKVYGNHYEMIVYKQVEVLPMFPGGERAMQEYFAHNIIYPEDARIRNKQGLVVLDVLVGVDGFVKSVEVVEGVTTDIDAEAVRVVLEMPAWTPAEIKGNKVQTVVRIPLTFVL